ncbi:LOW QUALITY PROTEIN: hypothetical protein SC1083_1880 [Aggregatibacter actinomycetemcomitans serotype e str. SC1083]|uniref:Zeta toxin domain-containing protein n=1 Tax=Aggregatibacter actinomycetemcomitans serotype e str. SC1083 TaxID=907488 RepID=G4AAK7_AGGAC|nr:zeta toxin family protein [Aggregatibacter actinomycetemcomitans]EGY32864.1 LOW QUALITY PROTEIN: hypothetical protein SC1083_1880 [Aggregatibacter actinomycetemcomitans serotype e str. SC1083]KYK75951.1 hypothetical protein SA3096_02445 [Aggregatibacter actinomycetemcomitans serotype e str. SA3096]KYK82088.1 hypothetical protein SC936_02580 [Aggregatibacter actinomycetemcomitans serotype e str. SC936]KYK93051.1 hypothetical protein ANH9776_08790 [Aggregatibacter actinomycetemcomitans serotyp
MPNNLAIFYCGTNGAGKSTLRGFGHDSVQIVIDSDNIAMQLNPENPRLADIEAGRKAIELFNFAIKQHIDFSMESTLSGKSVLQRMRKSKESGFTVRLNYIGVDSPKINIARVRARVKTGGHFIDEETIKRRYLISLENLINAVLLSNETIIWDNSGEKHRMIFQVLDTKEIILLSENIPNWCNRLLEQLIRLGF